MLNNVSRETLYYKNIKDVVIKNLRL